MPRPMGSKNLRRSEAALVMLKDRFGDQFEPLARLAEQAMALADLADESNDRQDRDSAVSALEKLVSYVHPKLKAMDVDVSNDDGTLVQPTTMRLVAVRAEPPELLDLPQKAIEGVSEHV